ncbi:MAG: daunorubicin resistance transporter ATPase subunit [Fibrobacteres bacterium]|nr:daunorubicin resistance transporter ATPase subunit [Fibrobacterota bacterium]
MPHMDAAIACEGLEKTYKNGVKALEGVSFKVRPGEIFGLLGPNGAGKSTTVRILATLTRPDGGTASVAGCDVIGNPAGVRLRIGLVAQASGVDKWATGRENLTLQAHLMRVPAGEIPSRVKTLLQWVDLTGPADRIVKTYSGGMKRRLDLAMGLVNEPTVLFLDEPTTGLDPETRAALWRDLKRLRQERNLTVLLTTHYLEEADHLCDRLAIVDHGKVVVEGTPAELKARISGDTVTLEVGGESARAAALLKPLPGVLETIADGSRAIVRADRGASAMPLLITTLERAGITVSSSTLSRPTLDDVYLHHTGRRFQGEGEAGSEPAA